MVKITLPDLSAPSVSTHHLLVGCQRREEEEKGVRREEGRSGQMRKGAGGLYEGDHLAKSAVKASAQCTQRIAAGANTQRGVDLPEATLRPWPPCHCHLSISQPLHLAICLEETYFLSLHSSSLHYPQEEQGKLCRRRLPGRVRGVSMSEPFFMLGSCHEIE